MRRSEVHSLDSGVRISRHLLALTCDSWNLLMGESVRARCGVVMGWPSVLRWRMEWADGRSAGADRVSSLLWLLDNTAPRAVGGERIASPPQCDDRDCGPTDAQSPPARQAMVSSRMCDPDKTCDHGVAPPELCRPVQRFAEGWGAPGERGRLWSLFFGPFGLAWWPCGGRACKPASGSPRNWWFTRERWLWHPDSGRRVPRGPGSPSGQPPPESRVVDLDRMDGLPSPCAPRPVGTGSGGPALRPGRRG